MSAGQRSPVRPRLDLRRLAGGYGDVDVVRGVSGAVAPGEVLCVIGRNGVGKSTLMKLLFGQLPCRAGSVRFDGRAIERRRSLAAAARWASATARRSGRSSTTSACATT